MATEIPFNTTSLIHGLRAFVRSFPMTDEAKDSVLSVIEGSTKDLQLSRNARERACRRLRPRTHAQRLRATAWMRAYRVRQKVKRDAAK